MLTFTPANAQHIGARGEQQDSFAFSALEDSAFRVHGGLLGIVADGMGGLEGGQLVSATSVEAFLAGYKRKLPSETIPAALYRSLEEANRAVLTVAKRIGAEGNVGSTIAAAVVHGDHLYWLSVGDSHIYVLRDGQLSRANEDHIYGVSLLPQVAAGNLERADAMNDPRWSHLTSHLGMAQVALVDLAFRPFLMRPGDTVIVCSDGIYRSASDKEIIEAFRRSPPAKACEVVKAMVLSKGRSQQDNLTIIAIQCERDNPQNEFQEGMTKRRAKGWLRIAVVIELSILLCLGVFYGVMNYKRGLSAGDKAPAHQQPVPDSKVKRHQDGASHTATKSPSAGPPSAAPIEPASSPTNTPANPLHNESLTPPDHSIKQQPTVPIQKETNGEGPGKSPEIITTPNFLEN